MTIRWLKGGCQGALSQGNPDSDDTSTWLNGSIRPHLEKIELPQSHQDDTRKPMSTSTKVIRDQQPVKHEGTLSTHSHSSSDEQRHSGIYDASFENMTRVLTCISHRLPS
ncbi:unnamed protein product [Penicillium nalgiovense]|nr:unnamed protein product [Penicillium nalgiovense]CAG8185029.1 unnamed protein product [Penicillium nalgiovense]